MNFLFKILILFHWLKVSPERMNTWLSSRNKNVILFTLKRGVFQERLLAIKALKELKEESTIPYLLQTAKNDYQEIAMEALNTVRFLDKDQTFVLEVEKVKLNWENKILKKKNRVVGSVKKNTISKQNRMQALERLRQQLKRPMAGGKWF